MTLKAKYIIYILVVHLAMVALVFQLLSFNKVLFIASEIFVIISLLIAFALLRSFYAPIKMLLSGIDAIKDKDFNVKYVKTGKIELDQLIDAYNQMINSLRQERTHQQEQHYFLEKLIHASPVGMLLLDLDGNIANMNPRCAQILGFSNDQLIGIKPEDTQSELLKRIEKIPLGTSETIVLEGFKTYKCQKSHFLSKGFPHTFIMLEELTAEKLKIEKDAYGSIIRMMAHEVNNTIGPVNSILDSVWVFMEKSGRDTDQPYIKAMKVAQARNQRLNQFMRNFADVVRLPSPYKQPVNLHELLQSIYILMEAEAQKKEIDFQLILPEFSITLEADRQQMEQALVNIVKNAFEAVEIKGTVKLCAEKNTILVKDNGKGISPELSDHIFSPFFSNKTEGQGIGLTLTKEILLNHQFKFSLTTNTGWTTFEIEY